MVDGISIYQNQIMQAGQSNQSVSQENIQQAHTQTTSVLQQELLQMVKGEILGATIMDLKGENVLLSLMNGQSIKAQLEHGVQPRLGETVLFQVKSNQNQQLLLRILPSEIRYNPTLQKALAAAGLPMTEQNLEMVNVMMQKQMPIDKNSLLNMARTVQSYPDVSPETLVQMKKLGFSITETSVQQFQSYKEGSHSLIHRFSNLMDELPKLLSQSGQQSIEGSVSETKQMLQFQKGFFDVLFPQQQEGEVARNPIDSFLSNSARETLEQQLQQIFQNEKSSLLSEEGKLHTSLTSKEFLTTLQKELSQFAFKDSKALQELFQGKEYKEVLKQVMKEQWMLEPEQVANKENIEKLYQRLNGQMERMESFLQQLQKEVPTLDKNVAQIRGNLEMMNQINQLYNYVQIPLKLQNQNAHSDLYVYRNKKKAQDDNGELSAFLHLELENLGTTDVKVKMLGNNVTTNFYLENDEAYQLLEEHMEELHQRLQEKGYNCNIFLENQEQEMDFVQDFLEKELPAGKVQQYSFNVLT